MSERERWGVAYYEGAVNAGIRESRCAESLYGRMKQFQMAVEEMRLLEAELQAARAEANRYRQQYEALESFVLAEKAVREHAEICVWWGWKPGACPNGVCRHVEARRDEAYIRAMTAMGLAEGGGGDG